MSNTDSAPTHLIAADASGATDAATAANTPSRGSLLDNLRRLEELGLVEHDGRAWRPCTASPLLARRRIASVHGGRGPDASSLRATLSAVPFLDLLREVLRPGPGNGTCAA